MVASVRFLMCWSISRNLDAYTRSAFSAVDGLIFAGGCPAFLVVMVTPPFGT